MTDVTARRHVLSRAEKHALLFDLARLSVPVERDNWTVEQVDGDIMDPAVGRTIVLRRTARMPSAEVNTRWLVGTYDHSEPVQVEVRITVPPRPCTSDDPEAGAE